MCLHACVHYGCIFYTSLGPKSWLVTEVQESAVSLALSLPRPQHTAFTADVLGVDCTAHTVYYLLPSLIPPCSQVSTM